MYAHFYQLAENPFNLTPDPKFHYINESTREAMASILHGIKSRKGFVTLIGEAGTGKTTLLKRVVDEIEGETKVVFVFNPGVSFDELLEFICSELGLEVGAARRLHLLEKLNAYLLEQLTEGRNVVVMIDEAQTLTDDVLEELRLLSNLETSKEKILQILLSGQPELEDKLRRPHLRQLRQRIAARATLRPMQPKEMGAYVETRMRSAGAERNDFFTPRALKRIWQVSAGIPRVINVICDNAMMIAFAEGKRRITAPILKEAIRDLQGEADAISPADTVRAITRNPYARYAAVAALILAVGLPLALSSGGDWLGEQSQATAVAVAPAVARVPEPNRALPPLPTELLEAEEPMPPGETESYAAYADNDDADGHVATGGLAPPSDPALSRLDSDPAMRDSVLDSIRRARLLARSTAARLYDVARGDSPDQDATGIVDSARSETSQTTQEASLAAAAAARREIAALAAQRDTETQREREAAQIAEAAREAEEAARLAEAAREVEEAARLAEAAREAEEAARLAEAAREAEMAKAKKAKAAREARVAAKRAKAARRAEAAGAKKSNAAAEAKLAAEQAKTAREAELAEQQARAEREAELVEKEAEASRRAEAAEKKVEAAREAELAEQQARAEREAELVEKEAEASRRAEAAEKKIEAAREVELAEQQSRAEREAELVAKEAAASRRAEAAEREIDAARRAEALAKKEADLAKAEAASKEAEAAEVAVAAREAADAAAQASAAASAAVQAAATAGADREQAPDALASSSSTSTEKTVSPDRGSDTKDAASSAAEGTKDQEPTSLAARSTAAEHGAAAQKTRQPVRDEPISVVGRPVSIRALGPSQGEPLIGHLVRVEYGDTIWDIAVAQYGDAGPSTLDRILASNPGIRDAKRLSVGAFLYMPFQNPDQMIGRDGADAYRVLVAAAPVPKKVEESRTWVRGILGAVDLGTVTVAGDRPVYELYAVGLPTHDAAFDISVRILSEYGRVRGGSRQAASR